jgi:hypothetical protein
MMGKTVKPSKRSVFRDIGWDHTAEGDHLGNLSIAFWF